MRYFSIFATIATAIVLGIVGAVAGIFFVRAAVFLGEWLQIAPGGDSSANWTARILIPAAAGLVTALIAIRIKSHFRGLADIVLEARYDNKKRDWRADIWSSLASLLALGGGASVGQYGPVGHIGGVLGAAASKFLGRGVGQSCGVAAAIAAVFSAPVTGLVFAHEVVLRHSSPRAFMPVAVSAVAGYCVATTFFGERAFLRLGDMAAAITPSLVVLFCLQGILFGALSAFYLRMIFFVAAAGKKVNLILRLTAAGLATGCLSLVAPEIVGGGGDLLAATVDGLPGGWQAAMTIGVIKLTATVLCLGLGFAGGIVSPTLVIGAMFGLLFGKLLLFLGWWTVPLFVPVICGMMALTGPTIGAPLAGILFVLELSGSYSVTVVAILSVSVAAMTAARLGGGSYYERQLLERGIRLTQSRERWRSEAQTIGLLAQKKYATVINYSQDIGLQKAIKIMTTAKTGAALIVDGDNRYLGVLRLADALTATAKNSTVKDSNAVADSLSRSDSLSPRSDSLSPRSDSPSHSDSLPRSDSPLRPDFLPPRSDSLTLRRLRGGVKICASKFSGGGEITHGKNLSEKTSDEIAGEEKDILAEKKSTPQKSPGDFYPPPQAAGGESSSAAGEISSAEGESSSVGKISSSGEKSSSAGEISSAEGKSPSADKISSSEGESSSAGGEKVKLAIPLIAGISSYDSPLRSDSSTKNDSPPPDSDSADSLLAVTVKQPALLDSDTLATAMKKTSSFVDGRAAVTDGDGKLLGDIGEGDLLAAYASLVEKLHNEETAV